MAMKDTDRRLLLLLCENARRSTSELARELDLSRSTVQGRIQRLERDGVIAGYTAILGDAYERSLVSAHVLLMVAQKLTAPIIRELHAVDEVKALYAISGDYDLIAVIQAESTEALSRII
ncbi:MAG: Lrp/AsnC family transcriptional regulator, partial [Pseudohongiellaceae bacterium]